MFIYIYIYIYIYLLIYLYVYDEAAVWQLAQQRLDASLRLANLNRYYIVC